MQYYPFTINPWKLDIPPAITFQRFTGSQFTECDQFGHPMPYTLVCCGDCWEQTQQSNVLKLAEYDDNFEYYIEVSEEQVQQFLDAHKKCTPKCWNCSITPVKEAGHWCEECQ